MAILIIPFDPLFTESVTVHKGTNSVRYGGNAIGGSVDIDTGLISKKLEDKSRSLDIAYKKGFNDFNAHGIRLNVNNQKNLSTNIQFSTALLHKPICKGFFSDIIFK
uniref:hypothetical protein n=1 Tax=Acinetobacter johnsonii TaxID=40214 RepID=UPI00397DF3F5